MPVLVMLTDSSMAAPLKSSVGPISSVRMKSWIYAQTIQLSNLIGTLQEDFVSEVGSSMARNFGHFRTETSCGLHEGFIYTAGIHGKVRADPTN